MSESERRRAERVALTAAALTAVCNGLNDPRRGEVNDRVLREWYAWIAVHVADMALDRLNETDAAAKGGPA